MLISYGMINNAFQLKQICLSKYFAQIFGFVRFYNKQNIKALKDFIKIAFIILSLLKNKKNTF